jgi:disulfide bond formation protein DsbB
LLPRQLRDFLDAPRRILFLIFLACLGLLGFGLYLQHIVGLEPCPMCIVQRYALMLVALFAGGAALFKSRSWHLVGATLALLSALFGAFVAARQSWLQWHPPEILSCGRDFYGMIEALPLQRAVPMIFRGSGDCAAIDWTFMGLSIANWSWLCFMLMTVAAAHVVYRSRAKHD